LKREAIEELLIFHWVLLWRNFSIYLFKENSRLD